MRRLAALLPLTLVACPWGYRSVEIQPPHTSPTVAPAGRGLGRMGPILIAVEARESYALMRLTSGDDYEHDVRFIEVAALRQETTVPCETGRIRLTVGRAQEFATFALPAAATMDQAVRLRLQAEIDGWEHELILEWSATP